MDARPSFPHSHVVTDPPEPSQLLLGAVAVVELFAVVTALVVVPRNRRPASATAWIILTVFVPVLGVLAFYVLGNRRLPAGRRRRQQSMDRLLNDHLWTHATEPVGPGPWLAQVVRLNRRTGALPMLAGTVRFQKDSGLYRAPLPARFAASLALGTLVAWLLGTRTGGPFL